MMWVPVQYLLATHNPPWLLNVEMSLNGTSPWVDRILTILYPIQVVLNPLYSPAYSPAVVFFLEQPLVFLSMEV